MNSQAQDIISVPFIDLRFEEGFEERVQKRWQESLLSKSFIGGIAAKELENKILDFTKAKHFVPCANGTDAIQLALRSIGIEPKDNVLIPDFTFWATYEAVVNVGANPIMIDVNFTDFQMDFDLFIKAVEKYKPKAAVLVHLYGWCSERLQDFRDYCNKHEIYLVEDAAQAIGTYYENKSLFEKAFIATISFYPAKVLGAAGDAGGIFTSNEEIARLCRQLSNHGRSTHYGHEYVGWNSRMDELQAHFLSESLDHLESRINSRRKSEQKYVEFCEKNKDSLTVNMCTSPSNITNNGYLQVSLAKTSFSELSNKLLKRGIKTGNVYPNPISSQKGTLDKSLLITNNKIAEYLSKKIINLPLFPYMKDEEISYVCECLKEA